MTGFGQTEGRSGDLQFAVEIRSVNQRNLDIKIASPREYGPWEADIRRQLADEISRGRVELYINRNQGRRVKEVAIQTDAAAAYVKALRKLKKDFKLSGDVDLSLLQGRSEIFVSVEKTSDPKKEIVEVRRLVAKALAAHSASRDREGKHLKKDMSGRLQSLERIHRNLGRRAKGSTVRMHKRLEKRLGDLLAGKGVERSRIVQEAALLADRADVTEELVRLSAHLLALKGLLGETSAIGKRIDFLLQEVHREFNTIGSKANDLDTTNLVLEGKAEIEKLREQVQNVE
jgi:uncharacterized protein (TIGR00255 family)